MTWQDGVGYLAAVALVASLFTRSIVRFRIIALVASVLFAGYAVTIAAWPLLIAALAAGAADLWVLRRELGHHVDIGLIEVAPESPFLSDFVRTHREDIARTQPEFTSTHLATYALVLTRDGLPAGALIGRKEGTDLHLELDYVLHAYRDSRLGHWLYAEGGLYSRGLRRAIARPMTDVHRNYLQHMGFHNEGDRWVKVLR